jgi:hypothetical protein
MEDWTQPVRAKILADFNLADTEVEMLMTAAYRYGIESVFSLHAEHAITMH